MRKEDFMEKRPIIKDGLSWHRDSRGRVTLKVENVGMMSKLRKMIFNQAQISYVHLDEQGSFVWMQLNGKNDVCEIGKKVALKYNDDKESVYLGLIKYFKVLESYKFIEWAN